MTLTATTSLSPPVQVGDNKEAGGISIYNSPLHCSTVSSFTGINSYPVVEEGEDKEAGDDMHMEAGGIIHIHA